MLAEGSRVLVTTRNDLVAHEMKAEEPYIRIDKLGNEDAWLLLKKQVVRDINVAPQVELLKDIGIRLVEKCDGLPLGVKVMGGLLRMKRIGRTDWQNVLDDSLWSVSQMPKELNYAVYLSYEDLRPCVKPCFLHYSLLPRDRLFFAEAIVPMWISEGYIHGTLRDLEEIGREYYDELIQRNLIEPDKRYVDQTFCNMHDIVRSFAQNVYGDEALIAHNSKVGIEKLKSQKFSRLSLESNGLEEHDLEWCSLQTQTSLRILILVGNIKIQPSDSFRFLSTLRTLHLDRINIDAIAESLYQLKHLRYLSITNSDTSKLPEDIGKLKFLQYISLYGCERLSKLPSSIGMLQDLRHLGIAITDISIIPRDICGLTRLRTLYGFPAHMDSDDHCSLEELGPLSQLTNLGIRLLENVSSPSSAIKARLGEKNHLRLLSLRCTSMLEDDGTSIKDEEDDVTLIKDKEWTSEIDFYHCVAPEGISEKAKREIEEVFDELCPPLGLEQLEINGYFGERLPTWMMRTTAMPLQSLRILFMCELACCTELPSGLSQLPCLEQLQISRAPAVKSVGHEFLQPNNLVGIGFPRLRKLYFQGMVEWEEWLWEEQVKGMPILEVLTLIKCKLSHVPPGIAFQAMALKELSIYDVKHLSSLENFSSVVELEVLRNADLQRISNLPKLQKLIIITCPKMKVLEGMPALKTLFLADHDMETVPRYLHNASARRFVLECSLSLLTCIAAGKSGPEWDKFNHIQQVKAYANDGDSVRHVLYTRNPFHFETNISRSAIAEATSRRTDLAYFITCPTEDEWPTGQPTNADKRVPLCVRFRCHAYRHLVDSWLRQSCLHCCEANGIASWAASQWMWIKGEESAAYAYYDIKVLQQLKQAS